MEKNLINALLRVYHSEKERHSSSVVLARFVDDYNVGQRIGTALTFSSGDRLAIRRLLLKTEGIDAQKTQVGQWDGLSRAESMAHGHNEKLTDKAVREGRVAIKTLPGHVLMLGHQRIPLPDGANLDMDGEWVAMHCKHTCVVVVENWEAFEGVHRINFGLSCAEENPLVVFRGSFVYRQDHAMGLLRRLALPVFALVDYDPSGLVLAQSMPHFSKLLTPHEKDLVQALQKVKNYERYLKQLAPAQAVLNRSTHPDIVAHWELLQRHATALPQEYFLSTRISC